MPNGVWIVRLAQTHSCRGKTVTYTYNTPIYEEYQKFYSFKRMRSISLQQDVMSTPSVMMVSQVNSFFAGLLLILFCPFSAIQPLHTFSVSKHLKNSDIKVRGGYYLFFLPENKLKYIEQKSYDRYTTRFSMCSSTNSPFVIKMYNSRRVKFVTNGSARIFVSYVTASFLF